MMPLNNSAAARQLGWSHPINPHDSSFTCHFMIERTDRALEARQFGFISLHFFLYFHSHSNMKLFSLWPLFKASGKGSKIKQDVQEEQVRVYTWQSNSNIQDVFPTWSTLSKLIGSKVMTPMQNTDTGVFVDSSIFIYFFLRLAQRKHRYFCVSFQQRILW